MSVTPDKIKSVLSSFLIKSEKTPSVVETFTKPRSQDSEGVCIDNDSSPKSNTVALRSHKSFLKRLDTFSPTTWFCKEQEISPLTCARHGWENVDFDMLQCVGCKAFLCATLPEKTEKEAYNTAFEKLKKNIVSAHTRPCVMGSYPCPEHFGHVQVNDVASLSSGFNERISDLCGVQDKLPPLDIAALERLGYDEGQAGAYCKRHMLPDKDVSPQAVTLAITGWTYYSQGSKDILVCCMCRRRIGLWNFTTSSESGQRSSSDDEEEVKIEGTEPAAKRQKMSKVHKKETLNPVEDHYQWCPWVQIYHQHPNKSFSSVLGASLSPSKTPSSTPRSQSSTPRRNGQDVSLDSTSELVPVFLAALKSIAPGLMDNNTGLATGMKKSPMNEGLRCFRRAMDTWSSPKSKSLNTSQDTQEVSPTAS